MFQLQLVFGLLIGFQLIAIAVMNEQPPIDTGTENEHELDDSAVETLDLSYADSSLFGEPDPNVHKDLAHAYGPKEINDIYIDPSEVGSYFEGDMLIPSEKILKTSKYWANGIVPYDISPTFSSEQKEIIRMAMVRFSSKTCVKFLKRTTEKDYVYIDGGDYGCFSAIGRTGGKQLINLDRPYCLLDIGTIIHELMHTLGFLHEHTRYDRDDYLKISMENIKPEKEKDFRKTTQKIHSKLGYDYASIMHYGPNFGHKTSGLITISPLRNTTESLLMGQRYGLSPGDVEKIHTRYCESTTKDKSKSKSKNQKSHGIALQFKSKDTMLDLLFNPKYLF